MLLQIPPRFICTRACRQETSQACEGDLCICVHKDC